MKTRTQIEYKTSIVSYFFVLVFGFLFIPSLSNAYSVIGTCSKNGYTVVTINGIFTDEDNAKKNKEALELRLDREYNGESLKVDYLHNPSHLAGLGDLIMSAYQKVFDNETVEDYDLVEILKDASEKVKTQKLLLVAHSQGNFYANSFYDIVAGKQGGVPTESIGVYAVATPASRVAGGGQWLTSDTDKVIADLVATFPFKKIMTSNTSIALAEGDDHLGHNFSGVYLKYHGSDIVSDIQSSLDKLKANNVQETQKSCFEPPKLTLTHKIEGAVLSVVDPVANKGKDGVVIVATGTYQAGKALAQGVYSLTSFIAGAAASVLSGDNKNTNNEAVALNAIKSENISSLPTDLSAEEADLPVEQVSLSAESNAISRRNLDIIGESFQTLQNQILTLQNQTAVSPESSLMPNSSSQSVIQEPKFIVAISPGFGGGGTGIISNSSSLSAEGAGLPTSSSSSEESSEESSVNSSSESSSSSSVESSSSESSSSSSASELSSSSSSSSSSSDSDTTAPAISSFSISECQNSLSSDGCLVATTTLNIAWGSLSDDLDYFIINSNGAVSTTTATSTIAVASDNTLFSFSVSAKDLAGNESAASTQTAEISTRPVVINEVAWAGNGAAYSADEWIELYNRTSKIINLTDWTLYSKTNLTPYVNLSGQITSKGYYFLERTNDNTVSNITADKIYTGDLLNSGENIALVYKSAGQATTTIDEIPYDFNWYAGSSFNYATMERYDPDTAGTDYSNWGTNNTVIKNGKNAGGGNINGTPKARNSVNYLINKGQNVSSDLTLYASGSPYLVNNSIQTFSASSTLTVEPGVVIKFYNNAGLSFNNGAKISAIGSSVNPIIFTSFYDDSYGGDTNGDTTSTFPSAGSWYGIRLESPGAESIISNAVFRYGGKYYNGPWSDSRANLYIANSWASISDSIFEYSKVYGLKMVNSDSSIAGSIFRNNNNILDTAGYDSSLLAIGGSPSLLRNNFIANNRGIYLSNSLATVDSNTFSSNAGEAIYSYGQLGSYSNNSGTNNSVNGIVIYGNLTSANSTTTIGVNSLPYVIKTYDATIVASSTLIIPSGIVLKADKKLNVNGNLNITGSNTDDVILTSLYDDTVGGDTTNNGSSNSPQAGQGGWISISNTGNFIGSGFTTRYGGSNAYGGNNSAWLSFDGSGGSISNALFDNNYPYGIYAANSSRLNISNTSFSNHTYNNGSWGTKAALAALTSSTTLSTVSFISNALGILSDSISAFVASDVTFTNNTATTSPGGLW